MALNGFELVADSQPDCCHGDVAAQTYPPTLKTLTFSSTYLGSSKSCFIAQPSDVSITVSTSLTVYSMPLKFHQWTVNYNRADTSCEVDTCPLSFCC